MLMMMIIIIITIIIKGRKNLLTMLVGHCIIIDNIIITKTSATLAYHGVSGIYFGMKSTLYIAIYVS